jgi:hypothetical protein
MVHVQRDSAVLGGRKSCCLPQLGKQMLLLFTPLFGIATARTSLVVRLRSTHRTTYILRYDLMRVSLVVSDFIVVRLFLLKAARLFLIAII